MYAGPSPAPPERDTFPTIAEHSHIGGDGGTPAGPNGGKRRTGWICHERYFWHDAGRAPGSMPSGGFVEPYLYADAPETKRRFRNLVEVSGLLEQLVAITPRPASQEDLLRLHTPEYVDLVKQVSARGGGEVGPFAPIGAGGYEIACLAVGGAQTAVDAVMTGEVDNAYALVRPAGHHAEAACGAGFCVFSNTALAALYALDRLDVERVAIVDWDVHHGNGTEAAFWERSDVLTISLHHDMISHLTGSLEDVGEGPGEGFNVNVPLPTGSGTGAYLAAADRVVAPALRAFKPDLVLIACGFDASAFDPLGRMVLHSEAYRELTRAVLDIVGDLCAGRLVCVHEGGYSASYVPFCGLRVVEELAAVHTGVEDPFFERIADAPAQRLHPHQADVIDAAARNVATLTSRMA